MSTPEELLAAQLAAAPAPVRRPVVAAPVGYGGLGQQLGELLGGGIGQAAETRGYNAGMQGNLLGAQTEIAIAKAKGDRDQQAALEELKTVDWSKPDAVIAATPIIARAQRGPDLAAQAEAQLRNQKYNARGRSSNSVQGEYNAYVPVGSHGFYDADNPAAGVQQPLGKELIPDATSAIQNYQFLQGLTPEQQQQFLGTQRQLQSVETINGVPTMVTRGPQQSVIPLSTLESEASAAGVKASKTQLGKDQAERYGVQINEGISAADSLPVINRAIELLESVGTGGFDQAKLAASNFFGITGADEAELSNNLGKAVLSQLKATFGAAFTEREGARLDTIEANFGKSTAGNKRLLAQAKQLVERAARRGIAAAEATGDTFSADEIRNALSMTLTPGKAAPSGGRSAPTAAPRTFASEAEAAAAAARREIKVGDEIIVNGVPGSWE